jgi:hypothetical protein
MAANTIGDTQVFEGAVFRPFPQKFRHSAGVKSFQFEPPHITKARPHQFHQDQAPELPRA